MSEITAIIKTFMRDEYLFRCIDSLLETYPNIKIIVGDDGFESGYKKEFCEKRKIPYVRLPFDCGITYARNKLIEQVKTKYVLIGDDDFIYTKEAGLEKMKKILEISDIAGGRVRTFDEVGNYQGFINREDDTFIYNELDLKKLKKHKRIEYGYCDLIYNFFLAKTEIFKDLKWDENIKVAYEHSDFFLEAKAKGHKVAFLSAPIVNHKDRELEDKAKNNGYGEFRNRKSDKDYFFKKHKISRSIDFRGNENKI
jgi:GT2 family glycosyltransferase